MHYLTTPLYYVNDTPHIGHAYTTVVTDVLNRYYKLFGEQSHFLTGTDEHGQKIQEAAKKRNLDPQTHVNEMVQQYIEIWKELDVHYDIFMRTTEDFHRQAVQKSLQQLFEKGDIYSQEYEGWYCVSDETFYQEKDLVNGKSPTGKDVTMIKEKNYFFKMSKYQDQLLKHIEDNPKFIQPDYRKNEILGFLRQPLQDLSISRPKARLSWGIELPFDQDHVTYVWFDALLNYATAIGYQQPAKKAEFEKWWPHATHIVGKDIITFHSVYWPTMLMALNVPLPKMIFAHGWWLTEGGGKMSKSEGTVVKPLDMKNIVGMDGLRYFLTRDIYFGNDATFSQDLVIARVNSELANNIGNLLSRTTNLMNKYFDGKAIALTETLPQTLELKKEALACADLVKKEIDQLAPNLAVGHVVDLLTKANQYLEAISPWKIAKDDLLTAGESLMAAVETLRIAAILLSPVMPSKMKALLETLGYVHSSGSLSTDTFTGAYADAKKWGVLPVGTPIQKASPLFPRVETK